MFIQFVGLLIAAAGGALEFGVYKSLQLGQIETVAAVLIPSVQLSAGLGVLFLRSPGRYFAFVLCCFYVILGMLSLRGIVSPLDYVPFVPLIEYIPAPLLAFEPELISIVCFLVIPGFVGLFLSSKGIAQHFDFDLKGTSSWYAPFLVMLASGFIISGPLIQSSRIDAFMTPSEKSFFGVALTLEQSRILFDLKLVVPILIGFGLGFAQKWAWVLALLAGGLYWFPFVRAGLTAESFQDFEFVFFGSAWVFTILTLFIHAPFFFWNDRWVERKEKRAMKRDPLSLGGVSIAPAALGVPNAPSGSPAQAALQRRRRRFPVFPVIFILAGIGAFVWFQRIQGPLIESIRSQAAVPTPGLTAIPIEGATRSNARSGRALKAILPQAPVQELAQESTPSGRSLILQGTALDTQGSIAIINNQVVQKGETIEGFLVKEIKPDRVLISKDGKEEWLER